MIVPVEMMVRIAVLDSIGNLIGYKVDTAWTLTENVSVARACRLSRLVEYDPIPLTDFLHVLNDRHYLADLRARAPERFDDKESLVVAAQDIESGRERLRFRLGKLPSYLGYEILERPQMVDLG